MLFLVFTNFGTYLLETGVLSVFSNLQPQFSFVNVCGDLFIDF